MEREAGNIYFLALSGGKIVNSRLRTIRICKQKSHIAWPAFHKGHCEGHGGHVPHTGRAEAGGSAECDGRGSALGRW